MKVTQPWEKDADYWVPILHEELKAGRARFGWSYRDELDLHDLKKTLDQQKDWKALNPDQQAAWGHASFLLQVKPDDYFVYLNMPRYGEATIVRITGSYQFGLVWDPECQGDFRHVVACEFVATFDRNNTIVPPYLQRRLKLQGAWYRIYAKNEFAELLANIKTGASGLSAIERLQKCMAKALADIVSEVYRTHPEKNLETLLLEVFSQMPNVNVRKGPDVNGADLEIEFESGLDIPGLHRRDVCAVQVKAYEGSMGSDRAIQDIREAFASDQNYTCGLIVSTDLELTEDFALKLDQLREDTGKPIGVLIGTDLARLLVRYGLQGTGQ